MNPHKFNRVAPRSHIVTSNEGMVRGEKNQQKKKGIRRRGKKN